MAATYEPMALSRSFPKIAVVCGAETELGQVLLRELLLSSEVEKVHFIARSDPEILSKFRLHHLRKVTGHIVSYDKIDLALSKIKEADLAFCCLGTERHAYETIGHTKFQMLNYDAPARFVSKMFELGVLYVSMLSHSKAEIASSSEMYKLRGELEDYVRKLRRDAADFSPYITMFKVSGMASTSRKTDKKEVAKAMKIDAMHKSCRGANPSCKKKRAKYEELFFSDVDKLLEDAKNVDEYDHRNRYWEDY